MANYKIIDTRFHAKASERYVDVNFLYPGGVEYETSVPIEYRRTGTEIPEAEIDEYLSKVREEVKPDNWEEWRSEQDEFWRGKPRSGTTKPFFDALVKKFDWCCVGCSLPPNPNWARRTQDIKEFGYTLSTKTSTFCRNCRKSTTQLLLLPIRRGGITGYETWNGELRTRIVRVLGSFDAFEGKKTRSEGLLPDHKFPEIRWDSTTRRETLNHLTDSDILRDFQLLSNQRNQQKREVCRNCFQTGQRGTIYGIRFFYSGGDVWDARIARSGKSAEEGCVGCGWYDVEAWRREILNRMSQT
jgi:hypothetical protein